MGRGRISMEHYIRDPEKIAALHAVISCDVTSGENIFTAIESGLTYHQFVLGALN